MKQTSLRLALYALFTISGAAGLIYESLWARYLGLFVGHSAYAQIIVLGIFLGGMALGALLAGHRSRRLADPLLWYARVELLVGILGIAFHAIYGSVTEFAYDVLFPGIGTGVLLSTAKWTLACLVILPQSVLLGTTFPLMGAGVLRRFRHQPGRTLSILYFANSLGAAVGVLCAGFWFLNLAGLPGTLLIAGGLNLVASLGTFLVAARYPPGADAAPEQAPEPLGTPVVAPEWMPRAMLIVAFGTAVASFIYEIGWIRALSLVLGGATHSFELMLSAFILGLALGSFWTRRHADRWGDPVRTLGIVQWLMGAAALATLPLYTASFGWMASLMEAFARTDAGYTGFSLARYGISLLIMLPATFCAGITLPLITRILVAERSGERAIGQVYGLNTLGSIVGVAMAGLILLPLLGLKIMIVAGAALDMALGAGLLVAWARVRVPVRRLAIAAVGGTVILAAWGAASGGFAQHLLASSVYRDGTIPSAREFVSVFHRDGRTATISVHRRSASDVLMIATNGKPDASLPDFWFEPCTDSTTRQPLDSDAATQALAPLITMAHAPAARRAAVIGVGSGMSSEFILGMDALEQLVTIEIEPAMTRGARAFYPANRRLYDDPRSRIVHDDAKSYFAASGDRFDVIVSEPSNPWVSGVSSLFSVEFYQRIRRYLSDDGVFGQWLHLYEIDDGLVLSVLAAIHQVFPSYAVYQTWNADMVIVAGMGSRLPDPAWSLFDLPGVTDDLCHIYPFTGRMLDVTKLLDRRALAPLLSVWGQPNSDYYPVLDLGAERARFLRTSARGVIGLSAARFDFIRALANEPIGPAEDTVAPVPRIPRMQAQATSRILREPPDGHDDRFPEARFTLERYRATLAAGQAPASWRAWLADFAVAEFLIHGVAQGWVDRNFYRDAERFLAATDAPEAVEQVVAFRRGLASWDFRAVAQAGDGLWRGVTSGDGYIPIGDFLDGLVTAKLVTGDPEAAEQIFFQLAPRAGREPGDLRLRLLEAYIGAALAGR